jgi:hypothetical protein
MGENRDMSESGHEPKKVGLPGCVVAVATIILLSVGYLLSAGPAVWAVKHARRSGLIAGGGTAESVALAIYYPIELLYEHTPMREPIQWYMEKWTR